MQSSTTRSSLPFIVYLAAASAAGMAVIYLATYRFGAGLSTDAVLNLSAASNLLQGKGLIDIYGHPLTQWPPLYPLIIAALSFLLRADIFPVAWHLNALVFGLCIFCSGLLFRTLFPDDPVFAYLGAAVIATCLGIIQISANVASDPLLLLFAILFLLFAARYAAHRSFPDLLWTGIFACLGSLQRYAGVSLVLAGAAWLAYLYRKQPAQALLRGGLFFVIFGAPIFAWGFLHNLPATGNLFGSYLQPDVAKNLYAATLKLLYWFIPLVVIQRVTPYGILLLLLVILLLLNRAPQWKQWFGLLTSDAHMASTIFFVLYAAMLVFYVSYVEHRNLESQRIHMVILPSLLILAFSIIRELILPHLGAPALLWKYRILALLAVLWLIYPVSKVWSYLAKSQGVESSGTNLYNLASIRESLFLQKAETLPSSGETIYSNYEAPAWFFLRTDIASLPRVDDNGQLDAGGLALFQDSLAAHPGGYIVWFRTLHTRNDLPDPSQLAQVAHLEPVLLSNVGDVYHIAAAAP